MKNSSLFLRCLLILAVSTFIFVACNSDSTIMGSSSKQMSKAGGQANHSPSANLIGASLRDPSVTNLSAEAQSIDHMMQTNFSSSCYSEGYPVPCPYTFNLVSPSNNAWVELGSKFKWTKFTPPSWITFWRYDVTITGNGQVFHRYATPYSDNTKTQVTINGLSQGSYNWKVLADYSGSGGQWSEEQWAVNIFDVRIKGPSSAVPRNNQTWYIDEHNGFGPYSYEWKVKNVRSQTVAGPFSTSTLSINQIPASIAYAYYYINLKVTFDAGTKNSRTLRVLMD